MVALIFIDGGAALVYAALLEELALWGYSLEKIRTMLPQDTKNCLRKRMEAEGILGERFYEFHPDDVYVYVRIIY